MNVTQHSRQFAVFIPAIRSYKGGKYVEKLIFAMYGIISCSESMQVNDDDRLTMSIASRELNKVCKDTPELAKTVPEAIRVFADLSASTMLKDRACSDLHHIARTFIREEVEAQFAPLIEKMLTTKNRELKDTFADAMRVIAAGGNEKASKATKAFCVLVRQHDDVKPLIPDQLRNLANDEDVTQRAKLVRLMTPIAKDFLKALEDAPSSKRRSSIPARRPSESGEMPAVS